MRGWLSEKLWLRNQIGVRLGIAPNRLRCVPHHASHAVQAFYGSGFDEAAVLVVDAVGEWATTSLWEARRGKGRGLRMLAESQYPHSLGLFYAAMTSYLGFRPNDGECNVMALSAFGRPIYLDTLRRVVQITDNGKVELDHRYFNFIAQGQGLFRRPLVNLLGPSRHVHQSLPFDALGDVPSADSIPADAQRYADIAASVQALMEEALLKLAQHLRRVTGQRYLCFAGGVALNAVANARLFCESGFDDVYIPVDPGDGGAAIGAAAYVHLDEGGELNDDAFTPYIGSSFESRTLRGLLEQVDPADWTDYLKPNVRPVTRDQLELLHYAIPDECVAQVASDLAAGQIVGWFQGGYELGPRALGNRSILCDAGNSETVRRLRESVKSRATFRPYALSIASADAERVLDLDRLSHLARWMQMVTPVRPEAMSELRGGVHVDRTTRPQICHREDNPLFHELLEAFGQHRPYKALLNTSFNEDGDPLVASPAEALLVFARSEMDVLVVNNLIVRKHRS